MIQFFFPAGYDDCCHAVAAYVADGPDHIQDAVDSQQDCHAFCRQVEGGSCRGDDDNARTGYACNAFCGKHEGYHDQQLLFDRHGDTIELGDEQDSCRAVQRGAIEVKGVSRRHDEGYRRFRYAQTVKALHGTWQGGFTTGSRKGKE